MLFILLNYYLLFIYKATAIAIAKPLTLSDAGISFPFKSKSPPSVGVGSAETLVIPPDVIPTQVDPV